MCEAHCGGSTRSHMLPLLFQFLPFIMFPTFGQKINRKSRWLLAFGPPDRGECWRAEMMRLLSTLVSYLGAWPPAWCQRCVRQSPRATRAETRLLEIVAAAPLPSAPDTFFFSCTTAVCTPEPFFVCVYIYSIYFVHPAGRGNFVISCTTSAYDGVDNVSIG